MFHIRLAAVVLFGASMLPAQGLITQKALPLEMAQIIAQGAVEKCRADGFHVSVSIIDASGLLKVFVRDEGTGPHTIDLSRRKAFTALTFASRWKTSGEAAKAWGSTLGSPMPNIEGTAGVAGGVPIKAGNETIGAIGVSGAVGGDKDEACAMSGISKVADKLK
ncbi:MAG TPA: heme-binding protein [Bryobacteraceae bacterium]|nr:heme-binding protein [Bryobacteraceae bacterium]